MFFKNYYQSMKRFTFVLFLLFTICLPSFCQDRVINVVFIGAHPDDADGKAGGTAIKLSQLGHNVLFVSLTNGDGRSSIHGWGCPCYKTSSRSRRGGKTIWCHL
ncbi:MAG: PIG-L deacetylase family protein [Fermentimonas sp.]